MREDWIKGSYKLLRNFRVLLLSSLTKSRRSRMSFHGSDPYGKLKVGRGPHFSFVMRQASLAALTLILVTGPLLLAQSSQSQNPSSPPSNAQSQDIPDAPSTVQPPPPNPRSLPRKIPIQTVRVPPSQARRHGLRLRRLRCRRFLPEVFLRVIQRPGQGRRIRSIPPNLCINCACRRTLCSCRCW